MAWEARLGLKQVYRQSPEPKILRLNGLGSPFGIETVGLLFFALLIFRG